MAITHDGISAPLPLAPVRLLIGLALLGAGGGAWTMIHPVAGGAVGLIAVIFFVNLFGGRRIRVLAEKLLVEDEPLITALLIGPRRDRIAWSEVKSVKLDGRKLVLETSGKPFVTAQGASQADLDALKTRVEAAIAKARKNAASS